MRMAIAAMVSVAAAVAGAASGDAALDRARARLATLTLDEKAALTAGSGTMSMAVPGTGREWQMSDSSHTVRANMERWTWDCISTNDESTVLPTLSALAATWDRNLAERYGHVIGEEARARGKDQMLGPGVNIMRTPLCGRNWEYMSEDPCLVSKLVVPEIKAIQSHGVAACVKHFALNSQELNRNANDAVCGERALNEIYLPAFEAAVKEADVLTVMTSYNKYNGDWLSENAYLQRGILRDRWHFKGLVVTDWGGAHSTAKSALNGGGVEMNRGKDIRYFANPSEGTFPLADAVRNGEIPESVLDEMALHTLWTMEKAGFFSPETREAGSRNTPEHFATAREIAEDAMVLLKNDASLLPLDPAKMRKIVVVGKLADTDMTRKGWSATGKPLYEITPLAGLEEYFAKRGQDVSIVTLPLVAADDSGRVHDVIESSIGTFDTSALDAGMSVRAWNVAYYAGRSSEAGLVTNAFARTVGFDIGTDAPCEGVESNDFRIAYSTRLIAPETGDYTFAASMDDRGGVKFTLDGKTLAYAQECGSIAAQASLEAGMEYDFSVEYIGDTGEHFMKFGWRLPSESGSIEDVREAAAGADAVLVFTGTEVGHGRALECEGADRPDLKLPEGHDAAIATILSWNLPNLVIVTHSGAPLELPWVADAATILHEPYLGQEAGRAFARVLFGDVCPSGKLPCTWPVGLEDTPTAAAGAYEAERSVYFEDIFVGYRWYEAKRLPVLFPFGYGLSYTAFDYGEAVATGKDGEWTVRVPVTNTGKVAGKEIVQLYVSSLAPAVPRPLKELKDFAKVSLAPGETKTVELHLKRRDFAYWDDFGHDWRADPGAYRLSVGASSADIRRKIDVELR